MHCEPWDSQAHTVPDCFTQDILQAIVPAGLVLAFLLYSLLASVPSFKDLLDRLKKPWAELIYLEDVQDDLVYHTLPTWKYASFISLSVMLLVTHIYRAITMHLSEAHRQFDPTSALAIIVWIYATGSLIVRKPITPSYRLLLLYTIYTASYILRTMQDTSHPLPAIQAGIGLLLFALTTSLRVSASRPAHSAKAGDEPNVVLSSPEHSLSLWNYWTWFWVGDLLSLAKTKSLDDGQVYKLAPEFLHRNLYRAMGQVKAPNLLLQLIRASFQDLTIDILLRIISLGLAFVPPLMLKNILEGLGSTDPAARQSVIFFVFLSFASRLLRCVIESVWGWHMRRSYERTRGYLMCRVVNKALSRQLTATVASDELDEEEELNKNANVGRIVNLVSGDSYNVAQWFWDGFGTLIVVPLEVTLAVIVLYGILGWATFTSFAIFAFFTLLGIPLGKIQVRLRRKMLYAKDLRINLVTEILESIRLLKNFAWEAPWLSKAQKAREAELRIRLQSNIVDALINLLVILTLPSMIFTAFFCYSKYSGGKLTVPITFPVISLYGMLLPPMMTIPKSFLSALNTLVSVRRLERYFAEAEYTGLINNTVTSSEANLEALAGVYTYPAVEDDKEDAIRTPFELHLPHIVLPRTGLVLITGPSGSGKSTMLAALLSELICKEGGGIKGPSQPGSLAFCSQHPWLESKTIRDNILFHTPYNAERYRSVLSACALDNDMLQFPAGDQSEIGERGVSLSGGQKARVALARAIYSHARYLLIDDALSALDAVSGHHVFTQALAGPLVQGRCVVLVTHHVKLCLSASNPTTVVDLQKGHATIREPEKSDSTVQDSEKTATPSPLDTDTPATLVDDKAPGHKFLSEETRQKGHVRWTVYKTYLYASGYALWVLMVALLMLSRGSQYAENWVLKSWGEAYKEKAEAFQTRFLEMPNPSVDPNPWLILYLSVLLVSSLISFTRSLSGIWASYRAARTLFNRCLERVIRAPSRYFDVSPVGRILNRLVADISTADENLQGSVRSYLDQAIAFLSAGAIVLFFVPLFLPFAVALVAVYWTLARPYRNLTRDLRRLENKYRSPLFTTISQVLSGLVTVRAYGQRGAYENLMFDRVDAFQGYDHFYWSGAFYIRSRFDVLGAFAIGLLTLVALRLNISQGLAAFTLVSAQTFTTSIHELIWSAAGLELDLSAIERIEELLHTTEEPSAAGQGPMPAAYWPSSTGGIEVEDLTFRYAPEFEPAINDVSFSIQPGQKVAVVGRTGSGKSSLALCFLRIAELSGGSIRIDGLDISKISLHELRSRISIVPQEPTLFAGTVRFNLDPLERHEDSELTGMLHTVGLDHVKLEEAISSEGGNRSSGERQLLSLARALLRNTNVYIFDESTASLDSNADNKVQDVIRELSDCIVISIAHRIQSIVDYDHVLVMENGHLVEGGSPKDLINRRESHFYTLCEATGDLEGLKDKALRAAS